MKCKEKAKAKQNKSIIIEEEGECPPPGPPVAGKQLADVLAGLFVSGGFEGSIGSLPAFFIANCEFVWGSRSNFTFRVAGLPGCFEKVLRLSCDFKPPFVGSSNEAPVLSSTGA